MKTKFDGIIQQKNLDNIIAIVGQVTGDEKLKTNLVEVIANTIYVRQTYFNSLLELSQIDSLTVITLMFDILLDKEINPYAAGLFERAINAFNKNIYGRCR